MTVLELFAHRVVDVRTRKGWSQYELANRSGVAQPTISRLERGLKKHIDVVLVRKLAQTLHVGVDYLVGTDEPDIDRKPAAVALVGASHHGGSSMCSRLTRALVYAASSGSARYENGLWGRRAKRTNSGPFIQSTHKHSIYTRRTRRLQLRK